ncbi:MAG: hypothetical protein ACRD0B_12315 [Acidimicrobiales bacterium]
MSGQLRTTPPPRGRRSSEEQGGPGLEEFLAASRSSFNPIFRPPEGTGGAL